MQWQPLGKHLYSVDGALILVETHGSLDPSETQLLMLAMSKLQDTQGQVLALFDVSGGASLPADSRRLIATWDRRAGRPAPTAIVGAGLALRTVATMVVQAIQLVSRKPSPLSFFQTQAEARAWLAEQGPPQAPPS